MAAVPLVRVVRSGLEESVHLGHVAVCDADDRLVAWAGDPGHRLFARSCMKPLQAAVSLRAAGEDVPDRELAVMCASHNGETVHVSAVRALLKRAGLGPEALRNPPGWPIDRASMARAHHQHRELHDCSGKHAGMLLACVRTGWDRETYLRAGHPLQRGVLRSVLAATGLEAVDVGVDGCGVPVHGMELRSMATLFARLARPDRLGELEPFAARAVEAMLVEPYLVGGRDRLDTDVMLAAADVVAKEGAEGLVCAGVLSSGMGIAIKVSDGGWRAMAPALIRTLLQIDALPARLPSALDRHARPAVVGGGRRVGEASAAFDLRWKRSRTTAARSNP
jgi:L-asparaginase II